MERGRTDERIRLVAESAQAFTACTQDLDELLNAVARQTSEALAAYCSVSLLADDAVMMRPLALHDSDAAALAVLAPITFAPFSFESSPIGAQLRAGEVIDIPDLTQSMLDARFPDPRDQESVRRLELKHVLFIPLRARADLMGMLVLVRHGAQSTPFTDEDQQLARSLADLAGLAIANARLLETSRAQAEERRIVNQHLGRLSEIARELAAATAEPQRLYDRIARAARDQGADIGIVRLLSEDREWLETSGAVSYRDPDIASAIKAVLMSDRARVDGWIGSRVVTKSEPLRYGPFPYEQLRSVFSAPVGDVLDQVEPTAFMIVPLVSHEGSVGILGVLRRGAAFSDSELALHERIAAHAAEAVANARLLAERALLAQRLQQVSGLAREFAAATVESGQLLQLIARRVSELLGDLCVVRTIQPGATHFDNDGACYHPDVRLRELAQRTMASTPLRYGEGVGGRVAATGKPLCVTLTSEQIAAMTETGYQAFIREMGMTSLVCVPLVVAGRIAGVISVARGGARPPFSDADVVSVEDLAAHAALAMGNRRLLAAAKAELVERVRDEEEVRRGFLEAAPDAVVIVDSHDRITLVNSRAEALFGHPRVALLQRSLADLVPPAAASELVGVRADGSTFAAEITRSPIETPDGTLVACAVRDVTERRQEYDERNRRTLEASRLKSEFLANMSHELRTPLNAIIGFTSLMHAGKAGPVSEMHREFLGDILTSGRHLLQLINDVLDLSKVEAGRLDVHPERIDLAKLVDEVQNIVRGLLAENRVKLTVDIADDIDEIELDPRLTKQVLYNYLSNAIKFTPEGGRVTLRITAPDAEQLRIDVSDTGIGIKPQDLGKLFTEFKQLETHGVRRHKGTGLGLALTKRIVEAQGGVVGVRSEVGGGSTFTATLPRRPQFRRKGHVA